VREHRNASGFMDAVNKLFHIRFADSTIYAVSQNVCVTTVERELQARNDDEVVIGERFANANVLLHPSVVKDFCVVAYGHKIHSPTFEKIDEMLNGFVAIGVNTVNVQNTFEHGLLIYSVNEKS